MPGFIQLDSRLVSTIRFKHHHNLMMISLLKYPEIRLNPENSILTTRQPGSQAGNDEEKKHSLIDFTK